MFLRGSRRRLEALRHQHCHGVVLSSFAAQDMCGPAERSVLKLPPQTYIREHRVFVRDGLKESPQRVIRVAIDRDSADLQRLAELEFQSNDVEFVPATFMQFGQLLESAQVDAIVWDVDEAKGKLPPTAYSRPLSDAVHQHIGHANTQANLVARCDDDVFATVIERSLNTSRLLKIQQEVLAGKRVPSY
ncbi:MAG: hypothetical protein IT323_22095 [Anaerolineae bacterium]|nr:hypothetical protein [Anaerolineae bacterium]